MYGLALRILSNPSDAEEVLQEVFLQLWRRAAQFDSSRGSLVEFLVTLARSASIDRLRARRTLGAVLAVPPIEPPPGARDRLLRRVRDEGVADVEPRALRTPAARRGAPAPAAPSRRMEKLAPLALATALAAMLFLGVGLSRARLEAEERGRLVALLADPRTPRLALKSGEAAVASAVYDAERREALVFAEALGPPPPGRTRVLWILPKGGGAPRNAGALAPDASRGGAHVLRDAPAFAEIAGLAVSEETDPAAAAPTKVVAAGTS